MSAEILNACEKLLNDSILFKHVALIQVKTAAHTGISKINGQEKSHWIEDPVIPVVLHVYINLSLQIFAPYR